MELTSRKNIKNLLKKYNAHPLKQLGQNFLINRSVLRKIIESAEPKKEDIILEIGPGIGTLTQEMAKKAKKVIAIEKDKKMVQILKETLADFKNVEIIHADVLNFQFSIFNFQKYKVRANLPYYITSPVIKKLLESKNPPKDIILMIQKEVARRISAKPPKMSILAVSVQFYAKAEIISFISKNSFWPQSTVDSAIIKIVPKESTTRPGLVINKDLFFKIVKAGFSQPRKQLANNLSKGLKLDKEGVKGWLLKNEIKPIQRAETLTVKDWIKLTNSLNGKLKQRKNRRTG